MAQKEAVRTFFLLGPIAQFCFNTKYARVSVQLAPIQPTVNSTIIDRALLNPSPYSTLVQGPPWWGPLRPFRSSLPLHPESKRDESE